MNLNDTALLVSQLAMGFALAACVGLRAFLPLFVAGLAARGGYVDLGASFQWMETTPALVVFGSAFVFEVLADKIPWLDHALHAAEVFVKPAAATLLAASLLTDLDPAFAVALGLIGGGTVAASVQALRGGARIASTAATGGLANPVLSIIDDVLAMVATAVTFLVPIIALILLLGIAGIGVWIYRRCVRARQPGELA
jgi:Domain of unknown function (DUF4126)